MRELMTEALQMHGFRVDAVATAESALTTLQATRYDVLLTDYRLPQQNGAWLLRQATKGGFLRNTSALVMSAETDPPGIDNFPLLRKPVRFELLVSAIQGAAAAARAPASPTPAPADLVLVLYVAPTSAESQRAVARLRRIVAKFEPRKVDVVIIDASAEDAVDYLEADRIVATPTLVKLQPGPKVWFVGSLENTELVEGMLGLALEQDGANDVVATQTAH